ncbi:hypothetical protein ACFL0E_00960, partial [Nanoarchaeota archaeon]
KKTFDFLAHILNSTWSSQVKTTGEIMEKRLTSGSRFTIGTSSPREEEIKLYEEVCQDKPGEEIPVGILETIALKTDGHLRYIPRTYEELTDCGLWKPPEEDADTLILVDVTVLESRRGKKGNGEAKKLINIALDSLVKTQFEYVWTYTPNIESVKKWHESLGAINTQLIILGARDKFSTPDVCVMNYSKKLNDLRMNVFPSLKVVCPFY